MAPLRCVMRVGDVSETEKSRASREGKNTDIPMVFCARRRIRGRAARVPGGAKGERRMAERGAAVGESRVNHALITR